jgi:hypothetical protein
VHGKFREHDFGIAHCTIGSVGYGQQHIWRHLKLLCSSDTGHL